VETEITQNYCKSRMSLRIFHGKESMREQLFSAKNILEEGYIWKFHPEYKHKLFVTYIKDLFKGGFNFQVIFSCGN
jgi:hypothetical protein